MLPKILISSDNDGAPRYCEAIKAVGGEPTPIYCPNPALTDQYDGLILTGGGDILPDFFALGDLGVSTFLDEARDRAELELVKDFLAQSKPVLGICRGVQVLNVALGGTIEQDLSPNLRPTHKVKGGAAYHAVTADPDSWLGQLYGKISTVNSIHHQALRKLGRGVVPCQWAADGVIEGISVKGSPAWGVQWHPERLCHPDYRPEGVVDGTLIFQWWIKQI